MHAFFRVIDREVLSAVTTPADEKPRSKVIHLSTEDLNPTQKVEKKVYGEGRLRYCVEMGSSWCRFLRIPMQVWESRSIRIFWNSRNATFMARIQTVLMPESI